MLLTTCPDLCLFRIFDSLPFCDLIRIHKICSRFASLKQSACLRRKRLAVHITRWSGPALNCRHKSGKIPRIETTLDNNNTNVIAGEVQFDLKPIRLPTLNGEIVVQLYDNFQFITALELTIEKLDTLLLEHLLDLLLSFSDKLQSLKLSVINCTNDSSPLFDCITREQFPLLHHLTIEIHSGNLNNDLFVFFEIVPHLREFYFSTPHLNNQIMIDQLRDQIGCENQLLKLGIGNKIATRDCIENYLRFAPEIKAKLTYLNFEGINFAHVEQYRNVFANFSSLESLSIGLNTPSPEKVHSIVKELKTLERLTHLKLYIDLAGIQPTSYSEAYRSKDSSQILTVPQVLALTLIYSYTYGTHEFIEHTLGFEILFPNINIVEFGLLRSCPKCSSHKECVLKMMKPFVEQCLTQVSRRIYCRNELLYEKVFES